MSEGFVKLHRSILNHPAFKGPQERWAFMELVALAAWKKTTVRYKDRVIPLERGQLSISIRDFARRMEWEQTRVLRFFKMLENHNMIRRSVCNTHPGVLTICNYCKYQDDKNQFATADATPAATAPQQRRNTEQEGKEVKEYSVPNGTAADCKSVDPKKLCYDAGKSLLGRYGIANGKAGGLITKWLRSVDHERLLSVIADTGRAERHDPIAYIEAAIQQRGPPQKLGRISAAIYSLRNDDDDEGIGEVDENNGPVIDAEDCEGLDSPVRRDVPGLWDDG